jgi:hypothetical protein
MQQMLLPHPNCTPLYEYACTSQLFVVVDLAAVASCSLRFFNSLPSCIWDAHMASVAGRLHDSNGHTLLLQV